MSGFIPLIVHSERHDGLGTVLVLGAGSVSTEQLIAQLPRLMGYLAVGTIRVPYTAYPLNLIGRAVAPPSGRTTGRPGERGDPERREPRQPWWSSTSEEGPAYRCPHPHDASPRNPGVRRKTTSPRQN